MAKRVVTIEGRRDAYSVNQILDGWYETMTVGELIEHLKQFDEDMPIMLKNDNGYTYGAITETSFDEEEDEDEEEEEDEEEDDDEEDEE